MDKTTHEIRLANWKQLIEQCASRPKGQTTHQWITEHGVSEKQYYNWQRQVRVRACEELESQGLMAPATPKGRRPFLPRYHSGERRTYDITPSKEKFYWKVQRGSRCWKKVTVKRMTSRWSVSSPISR